MAKIKDIVKSKLTDKSKLGDWYQKRLDICKVCPLNSRNFEPKTVVDKSRYTLGKAANLGKHFCTVCLCGIENKTSLRAEACPEGKWKQIEETDKMKAKDFELQNLSEDKANLQFANHEFVLDYGKLSFQADTKVNLMVRPTAEDFTQLRAKASCGCTTPTIKRQGKDIKLTVEYDTHRIGEFSKLITLDYVSDQPGQILVRIKGEVLKP